MNCVCVAHGRRKTERLCAARNDNKIYTEDFSTTVWPVRRCFPHPLIHSTHTFPFVSVVLFFSLACSARFAYVARKAPRNQDEFFCSRFSSNFGPSELGISLSLTYLRCVEFERRWNAMKIHEHLYLRRAKISFRLLLLIVQLLPLAPLSVPAHRLE